MENNSVNTEQASGQAAEQASVTTAINETGNTGSQGNTGTNGQPDNANVSNTINEAAVKAELKRARDEAAAKRVEATALQAKLDEMAAETAKLKAEHEALAAKAKTLEAERAISIVAKDAIYPELLLKQVDIKDVLDDNGNVDVSKVTTAVSTLRAQYPNMFTGTGSDAARRTVSNQPDFDNMSQVEYEKWRASQGY